MALTENTAGIQTKDEKRPDDVESFSDLKFKLPVEQSLLSSDDHNRQQYT